MPLRAPALNDVPRWKVEVKAGRITVKGKLPPAQHKRVPKDKAPASVLILGAAIADTIEESGAGFTPVISGTTHRESHGAAQILLALSRVHVRGVPVDWTRVLGGGQRVSLPTYPFQHQRY